MSAPGSTLVLWTWRRWLVCIALTLITQLGLIWWLSDNRVITSPAPTTRTQVRLLPSLQTGGHIIADQADPTLFALVSQQGFSKSAWLTVDRFEYQMTNRPEPLRWLTLPMEDLADDFAEFVQTNLLSEDLVLDNLAPTLAQPSLPAPLVVSGTELKIEGTLAARPLLSEQGLPQLSTPLLTNTVVQVFVDPAGLTLSAALLATNGIAAADQAALAFARTARFAPATHSSASGATNVTGYVFGNLVFRWARVRWGEPSLTTAKR